MSRTSSLLGIDIVSLLVLGVVKVLMWDLESLYLLHLQFVDDHLLGWRILTLGLGEGLFAFVG